VTFSFSLFPSFLSTRLGLSSEKRLFPPSFPFPGTRLWPKDADPPKQGLAVSEAALFFFFSFFLPLFPPTYCCHQKLSGEEALLHSPFLPPPVLHPFLGGGIETRRLSLCFLFLPPLPPRFPALTRGRLLYKGERSLTPLMNLPFLFPFFRPSTE